MRFWKNSKKHTWLYGVLAGIAFLGIGIWENQFSIIWRKAVMICMECIGIG